MNSTAPLWVALISPIAALLGAALGLFGALVVSRRATRTAFRQALYSGQLSRQQEVLTTYYEHIGAMYDELLLLPTRSRQDVADREEFHQALLKATGYGKRHHIWVPVELWDKYIEMVSLLQAKQSEIMDAASDEVLTDDEYELVRERIDQWMQGEGSSKVIQLANAMMPILGLKERGVFILSEDATISDLDHPRRRGFPTRRRPRYDFRGGGRSETTEGQ